MNDKEKLIVDELLDTIFQSNGQDRGLAICCYADFLNTINTRLVIEAQQIENEKNRLAS